MILKKIFKAVFRKRNLILLSGVFFVSFVTEYLPFMLVGAAVYVYFVLQTLKDDKFYKEISEEDIIDDIQELNSRCSDLYDKVRMTVDKQYTGRLKSVIQDKDEILELFSRDSGDYLKQKVVAQAVNLVMSYINLLSKYNQRRKEIVSFDISEIIDRINSNERKLQFLKDPQAIEDIKNAVEMDKEVLGKIDQDKKDLERLGAKLTYVESVIKTFKHQIITSENTDETVTEIESIINEAAALDNVLDNARNGRLKL